MTPRKAISITEILLRGSDVVKAMPGFTLVGRERELAELSSVLMKMRKRNLVVTGRGGVGVSAIILGIQDSKKDHRTPVDIVGKRFYWLVTDRLFESGRAEVINELFLRVRQTLTQTRDTVVVLEDTVDFIKAAQQTGCTNLLNGFMGDLKTGKYQAILETSDDDIGEILKCDSDLLEFCTLYEVKEPDAENLRCILAEAVKALVAHHGIGVLPKASETAAALTEKYKLPELRAQPDAAITLLDQALTDFSRDLHTNPKEVENLKASLLGIDAAIAGEAMNESLSKLTTAQLTSLQADTQRQLTAAEEAWHVRQAQIRHLYREISDGEEEVRKLEDEIISIREAHLQKAQVVEQNSADTSNQGFGAFSSVMAKANMDTPEIAAIKTKIKTFESHVENASKEFKTAVAEIYADANIDESHVLRSFSRLSGIPVSDLNEEERVKLRHLEETLRNRVIGQDEPTSEIAKAVKRARIGLKMPNKPAGTFMFLGPSGVGKTELAKALSDALGVPLLRFDMSEYMEKHAVAKFIGAPPGYEGYEHGGILTNAARRNPYSVVLFDEIEKAHTDVFNVMLQLLDDARLTDSRGLTASFKDTIVIMTTNIGTSHFLDEALPFEEAKQLAYADLQAAYRPEFLGRFGGNIYCFQRLAESVLLKIAKKDIERINQLISDQNIRIEISESELLEMIYDTYSPREGARSVLGYIDRHVTSGIADLVLNDKLPAGTIAISYDKELKRVCVTPMAAGS